MSWHDALKADLQAQGFALIETHISLVFLGVDRVYKIKKPVALGFLDFSSPQARRSACEAEVTLNRRLAPGVYLGVVPVHRDAAGRFRVGEPEGPGRGPELAANAVQEWAVAMRRLPAADAADRRLAAGTLGREDIERVAQHLARFHDAAARGHAIARFGSRELIEHNVRENFDQTRQSAPRYLAEAELHAIEVFQLRALHEHEKLLAERTAAGRVCDGHGDLRLEHLYLAEDGELAIIDCIEFNERFRYADVCADLAFLSMDLQWHQRHDLAEALLAAYARESSDYDLYALVDFYESYRAYVRGKVSAILADDPSAPLAVRERAAQEARKYFLLAEACAREPLERPALYVVCGVIAAGKSTVARALAEQISAPVLDADRTRKHLAQVGATTPLSDPAFAGHYSQDATQRVYRELLRRAEVVLRSGRPAVLDASFRSRAERAAARALARRLSVRFLLLECSAPEAVCRARLAERERRPSVSDGRLAIFDAFVASYEPIDELAAEEHLRIDTTAPLSPQLRAVLVGA